MTVESVDSNKGEFTLVAVLRPSGWNVHMVVQRRIGKNRVDSWIAGNGMEGRDSQKMVLLWRQLVLY